MIINDFPNDEEIRNMPNDKLLECYKKWVIVHDALLLDRDKYASDKFYSERFMSDENAERRKEHREKHKDYSNKLSKKIRLAKEAIDKIKLEVKWWEDSSDDPLYNWFFKRMGKKELIKIIDYLNKSENWGIKRSGTIPELRRRVMEYIPKNQRKEIITKILAENE